jgi:hypothetical protein
LRNVFTERRSMANFRGMATQMILPRSISEKSNVLACGLKTWALSGVRKAWR